MFRKLCKYIVVICSVMMLVSCAEDDFVSAEPEYHDAVLIKCAVADYITEESDMTRGLTRGMSYDDNMITKLDLLIFEKQGSNENGLLKHLTTEISETGKYTWDITGQMPKDYLKNKNVAIYLIANYYPGDHGKKKITDFNPSNANTFFIVSSTDPFPPGDMLNHGIVMSQVMEGTKNYTTDGNNNLIMNFNNLERVMAKAEFFVKNSFDLQIIYEQDFEEYSTFKNDWTIKAPEYATFYWGQKNDSRFLNAKNINWPTKDTEAFFNIDNEVYNNTRDWKIEFDFAAYNSNYNNNKPYFAIKDGTEEIFKINYWDNKNNPTVTWWDIDEASNTPSNPGNTTTSGMSTIAATSFEKSVSDEVLKLNGVRTINYTDKNGDNQKLYLNMLYATNNLSGSRDNSTYYSFKVSPSGLVDFIPTNLKFKTARVGANSGKIDVSIIRNGNEKFLLEGISPERHNDAYIAATVIPDLSKVTPQTDGDNAHYNSDGYLDWFLNDQTATIPFEISQKGPYNFKCQYGTTNDVTLKFEILDKNGTNTIFDYGSIDLGSTGGWTTWKDIEISNPSKILDTGSYNLKITFNSSSDLGTTANIRNIQLISTGEKIEADDDKMDGDKDAGTEFSLIDINLTDKGIVTDKSDIEVRFYIYGLQGTKNIALGDITLACSVPNNNETAIVDFNNKKYNIWLDGCYKKEDNPYSDIDRGDSVGVSTWYHLELESTDTGTKCSLNKADGTSVFTDVIETTSLKPDQILMGLPNTFSQWAIDNLKIYASVVTSEITEYKVQNYTNGYTLFNIGDVDKSTTTEIKNKADVSYTNTDFTDLSTHPQGLKDAENNSFAFYFYPNYWFDEKKATKMHEQEPIIYGRQTHVLVKANYQEKDYFYKIPVNYRLPKYSDAHRSTDHFNSKIDAICDTQYPTIESQWTEEFYNYVLNYMYYTYETCSTDNKAKLQEACKQLYNAASTAGDNEKAKTAVKDMIGSTDIYNVFKEKNEIEAERLCRIQRNHHYKITVNIDKPGGETADEAVYIMPAPYGDITARPEF